MKWMRMQKKTHTVECVGWGVWIFVLLAVGVGGSDVTVEVHAFNGGVVPCEFAQFDIGVLTKFGSEGWTGDDVDDAIGDGVGVPEIDFECMAYHFGDA